jgi:hypothetical protein
LTNSAVFWGCRWDILEQVVGEIHDEFDVVERPLTLADGAVIFDAALNVRDLDTQYGIAIPEDPAYATVGGFVLDQLGFIPQGGENFIFGDFRFTIAEMDGKRVARVKADESNPSHPPLTTPKLSLEKPPTPSFPGHNFLSDASSHSQALSADSAGPLAGAHPRLSDDSHCPRRSSRADAR